MITDNDIRVMLLEAAPRVPESLGPDWGQVRARAQRMPRAAPPRRRRTALVVAFGALAVCGTALAAVGVSYLVEDSAPRNLRDGVVSGAIGAASDFVGEVRTGRVATLPGSRPLEVFVTSDARGTRTVSIVDGRQADGKAAEIASVACPAPADAEAVVHCGSYAAEPGVSPVYVVGAVGSEVASVTAIRDPEASAVAAGGVFVVRIPPDAATSTLTLTARNAAGDQVSSLDLPSPLGAPAP